MYSRTGYRAPPPPTRVPERIRPPSSVASIRVSGDPVAGHRRRSIKSRVIDSDRSERHRVLAAPQFQQHQPEQPFAVAPPALLAVEQGPHECLLEERLPW